MSRTPKTLRNLFCPVMFGMVFRRHQP